jgi:endo-1,4-beta-xylanase
MCFLTVRPMKKLLALAMLPVLTAGLAARDQPLKDAAHGLFTMGVALNARQIQEADAKEAALVARHFNSITPENVLKWVVVHPEPDRYDFEVPDRFVALGERMRAEIIGHTLLWHQQVPAWVFKDAKGHDVSREELARRLREHIHTVVGRYKGRIHGWDVVNEAIDDSGRLRTDEPWYRILGEDALRIAFAAAREADPHAELYYNDYSLENGAKRKAVIALLQKLRAEGLRIDAVGVQEHYMVDLFAARKVDAMMADFVAAGFPLMVTELEISMLPRPRREAGADLHRRFAASPEYNPYPQGLPADQQQRLAKCYAEAFGVYVKYAPYLKRVTVWGLTDRASWLNNWPIRGRTDHPLYFDRQAEPKPAVGAILTVLQEAPRPVKP